MKLLLLSLFLLPLAAGQQPEPKPEPDYSDYSKRVAWDLHSLKRADQWNREMAALLEKVRLDEDGWAATAAAGGGGTPFPAHAGSPPCLLLSSRRSRGQPPLPVPLFQKDTPEGLAELRLRFDGWAKAWGKVYPPMFRLQRSDRFILWLDRLKQVVSENLADFSYWSEMNFYADRWVGALEEIETVV